MDVFKKKLVAFLNIFYILKYVKRMLYIEIPNQKGGRRMRPKREERMLA